MMSDDLGETWRDIGVEIDFLNTWDIEFDASGNMYICAEEGGVWESDYFFDALLGDVNFDEVIDIVDIILIINYILGDIPELANADVNLDDIVDILDIVAIVDIILGE